ncbi:rolling circle replication-associated protein [Xylella fastidiosa]|uniref:rolling circle replication-associated protein n=1 Tax=Xylella fastidiosa TaxID=2371 RepID=UPI001E2C8B06|nr:replication protein [Xylella fastidiosa]
MNSPHIRTPRGEVQGWSPGAVRRNTEFLMCVREDKLTGAGLALTLTVRDCPATAGEWQSMRRAWEKRMKRAGMVRVHWVTEWQRRGVPHLHCAIWFSGTVYDISLCVDAWLAVASSCGAGLRGQHARIIDGVVGWFQYVSKHAARGVRHYQRCSENLPEGWKGLTGRVWGKVGDWPVRPGLRIDVQDHRHGGDGGWFVYRRLVRSWRVSDARRAGDRCRLRSARRMLTCSDTSRSRAIGFMEWVPLEVQMAFCAHLAARGYSVTSE